MSEEKKNVTLSKEIRLHYISKERRLALRENGNTDPPFHNIKGLVEHIHPIRPKRTKLFQEAVSALLTQTWEESKLYANEEAQTSSSKIPCILVQAKLSSPPTSRAPFNSNQLT
ncbi:hypothetical protein J1N35_040809 [Gossypium stocksii]|uniref:Uncharacterized protein n=1 Tax=Gossypium stocksii TaxID=47602 RepID=A0A9D3UEA3_9ROSI|nr:hypothetical protein J1N35_040809 [Gossypium stocksii]